jgi:hypothetical protein
MTQHLWGEASSGLFAVSQVDAIATLLPRHMLVASDVWDEFICSLFNVADETGMISEIKGDLEESKENLRKHLHHLPALADLLKSRKFVAMYTWGFPEIDAEAERDFRFSEFDDWLNAVKTGRADHRTWLFEEKTLARVRAAYRRVRSGRQPDDLRIDKENWTLKDIYRYHPRGKDPAFWEEVLEALKSRNAPEHLQHRKNAVPEGFYSEFKKKETEYITEMLDSEERKVTRGMRSPR